VKFDLYISDHICAFYTLNAYTDILELSSLLIFLLTASSM